MELPGPQRAQHVHKWIEDRILLRIDKIDSQLIEKIVLLEDTLDRRTNSYWIFYLLPQVVGPYYNPKNNILSFGRLILLASRDLSWTGTIFSDFSHKRKTYYHSLGATSNNAQCITSSVINQNTSL